MLKLGKAARHSGSQVLEREPPQMGHWGQLEAGFDVRGEAEDFECGGVPEEEVAHDILVAWVILRPCIAFDDQSFEAGPC
jgi:hypothetical protein